jgi:hypothetical protein
MVWELNTTRYILYGYQRRQVSTGTVALLATIRFWPGWEQKLHLCECGFYQCSNLPGLVVVTDGGFSFNGAANSR